MDDFKKSRSNRITAVQSPFNSRCDFCGSTTHDVVKFGPKYALGKIVAHYYCVLLSNTLQQNGKDNEGMLGFLLKDIERELQRCSRRKCIYCSQRGATIMCRRKKCKNSFHLPCGLKKGTSHQFTTYFNSYCHVHTFLQPIPRKILEDAHKNKTVCCICFDEIALWNKMSYIWAPCCQKTWYHKKCLQTLALSAGYFFRCAACNNSTKFIDWVLKLGVFIPQQDASWELVPNAFSELLFKYEQCDADNCKCPGGRTLNRGNSIWEVIVCKSCGSQGIHMGCRNVLINNPNWECPGCLKITQNLNYKKLQKAQNVSLLQNHIKATTQDVFPKKRSHPEDLENYVLDKRKRCKSEVEDSEDEEVDIDVVTVAEESSTKDKTDDTVRRAGGVTETISNKRQDLEEVLAAVKPGPLSYKLKMIENYSNLLEPSKKMKEEINGHKPETPEIVTISDDENPADVKRETPELYSVADLNIVMCNHLYAIFTE